MNIDTPELSKRMLDHDLRPTEARRVILALLSEKNDHLSTEGIIKALQAKGYPLSIATLYQNLEKLVEAGLLVRIKGVDGIMRFDANLSPHHHLICHSCGKMTDVRIDGEIDEFRFPLDYHSGQKVSDWHVDDIKIEYRGTCPKCQKKTLHPTITIAKVTIDKGSKK